MPIIVISGLPASGKSTRAHQLQEYFMARGKKVHLISENVAVPKALFEKNAFFGDSQKEKVVRSDLKSEASRQLNKQDVIILDAGNYIKGRPKSEYRLKTIQSLINFCRLSLRALLHDKGGADHTVHGVHLYTAGAGLGVQYAAQRAGSIGSSGIQRTAAKQLKCALHPRDFRCAMHALRGAAQ